MLLTASVSRFPSITRILRALFRTTVMLLLLNLLFAAAQASGCNYRPDRWEEAAKSE